MRNEQHGDRPLELVDGSRKVFRCLAIEIRYRFIKNQYLWPFQ